MLSTGFGGNGVIEVPAAARDLAKLIVRDEAHHFLKLGIRDFLKTNKANERGVTIEVTDESKNNRRKLMNIAVLIKQVSTSNDVSVDPETHALVRASSEGMIDPAIRCH